ncbi:hypothetical protein [Marinilabilia salmonicolor]|uniref:hypothetical protein n=1 Tax=Marinilabilia salmonicolor TaxID=989 RepID=UPI00029ABD19|nr:hypothetical protein [Marinilabilia salmonicolor]
MKPITITLTIILIGLTCQSQELANPKKIRFKDNYEHKYTNTEFPEIFLDGFELTEVHAFDKKKKNIAISYKKDTEPVGEFTIYIYPAGEATENRLRNEYLSSMQSAANFTEKGLGATQYPVKYNGNKIVCNGFKADFKSKKDVNSSLSVYECGTWFFKLRFTTEENDSMQIAKIENSILEKFDPSLLAEQKKLNKKANVYFSKTAFRDSILLGAAMGSAYKKIEWVMEQIPEKEKASGFPGHYLEMQIASFKEFIAFDKKYNYKKSEFTQNYLNELNVLIESDFLDEYIMEQFSMVMIVPEEHEFNFDNYEKWKTKNNPTINLNQIFYVIEFGQKE